MNKIIEQHIKIHQLNKHEQIVLGCTHYELVKYLFEKHCPNTKFINNSENALNNFNLEFLKNDLNIVILTSKKDSELERKILKLIKTD